MKLEYGRKEDENSVKDHNSVIRNKKRIEAMIPSEKTDSFTLESMNIQQHSMSLKDGEGREIYDFIR
jgi:hypothetical protein